MQRLKLLLDNKVIPVVVFDGGALPMKKLREVERRQKRDEAKSKGLYFFETEFQDLPCYERAMKPKLVNCLIKQ
jgi:exonuclease-1